MNALALPAVADAPAARSAAALGASNHAAISFTVSASLAQVYDRWLQYPAFPHFMRGTDEGGAEEQGRITWRIRMDDFDSPWEAEVSEQIPRERISWKNIYGRPARNGGSVSFRAVGETRTQVTITIEFEFSQAGGPDPLSALATRLERNLVSFAEFARALEN